MWQALKNRINKQFNIQVTDKELALLHFAEKAQMQAFGMGSSKTAWEQMASGGVLDGSLIASSVTQMRQADAFAGGALATPQPVSNVDMFQVGLDVETLQDITPIGAAGGSMGELLRRIIQLLGPVSGTAAARALHTSTRGITKFSAQHFQSLPGPVQSLLQSAGITSAAIEGLNIDWGADFFDWFNPFDDDEEPADEAAVQALIDSWSQGGAMMPVGMGAGMPALGVGIVKTWVAGHFEDGRPIRFFRLANGLNYAEKENGTWKAFRYKKGTMIYSDGATTLQAFIRAERGLARQGKQLRRALDRVSPRRAPRASKAPVIIETGPGSVHTR